MFVLAIDIGYSNLKVVWGEAGSNPQSWIAPSGCGPREALSESVSGGVGNGIPQVLIGGRPWVAGVGHSLIESSVRELHADYPSTEVWEALFKAALRRAGRERVDVLVTGLPVSQHQDPARRDKLKQSLVGSHQVTPSSRVTVQRVAVLSQPTGTYLDAVATRPDLLDLFENGRTVVLDPGFFSMDWLVIDRGRVNKASSGTSLNAMSVLIERVVALVREATGAVIDHNRIEDALRLGQDQILVYGQWVSIKTYLENAEQSVAAAAMTELRRAMRGDASAIDVVLIAGGGAKSYEATATQVFPYSRVIIPDAPELANARGFWQHGQP